MTKKTFAGEFAKVFHENFAAGLRDGLLGDDGVPINVAVAALDLTEDERAVCLGLVGVRTLGDLKAVLERGEVDKALAAKLRKALGG